MGISIRAGCDIVKISRIKSLGKKPLLRIFHESEIRNRSAESLAGIFAAKESCRKAFNELQWHDITIGKTKEGKPIVSMNKQKIRQNIISSCVSISHDGEYAIANAVFLVE